MFPEYNEGSVVQKWYGKRTMTTRITKRFEQLNAEKRSGLITFVMGGDPDYKTALDILKGLPEAGADLIEIGMPFTDPMADGPSIQKAGLRALETGQTLRKTLELASDFRKTDDKTPLIVMGYYNPIYIFGVDKFLLEAKNAGIDGLIVVDLPPEEDSELCIPALEKGLDFIRLATPTSDDKRLPSLLKHTSGFIYYISIAGVTGTKTLDIDSVSSAVNRLRHHTTLPVAVGFGVKTPEMASKVAQVADSVVVGSGVIDILASTLDTQNKPTNETVPTVLKFVKSLSDAIRAVKK